jgi:hypothetical protein
MEEAQQQQLTKQDTVHVWTTTISCFDLTIESFDDSAHSYIFKARAHHPPLVSISVAVERSANRMQRTTGIDAMHGI